MKADLRCDHLGGDGAGLGRRPGQGGGQQSIDQVGVGVSVPSAVGAGKSDEFCDVLFA